MKTTFLHRAAVYLYALYSAQNKSSLLQYPFIRPANSRLNHFPFIHQHSVTGIKNSHHQLFKK